MPSLTVIPNDGIRIVCGTRHLATVLNQAAYVKKLNSIEPIKVTQRETPASLAEWLRRQRDLSIAADTQG